MGLGSLGMSDSRIDFKRPGFVSNRVRARVADITNRLFERFLSDARGLGLDDIGKGRYLCAMLGCPGGRFPLRPGGIRAVDVP